MKRTTFFITGTDTGVGKTVLTALLVKFLREAVPHCGTAALKPICSGGRDDARVLLKALRDNFGGASVPASHFQKLTLDEINPWHFRAPIAPLLAARRENKSVKPPQLLAHIRAMQKRFDVLLVEGAGGLLSPLGENFNSRDLILKLRATPIIVAQNKLGVINQILLTLEALPDNSRRKTKIVLMSPPKPDTATKSNARLLAEFFPAERIFMLPRLGGNLPAAKNPRVRRILRSLIQI